MLEADLQEYYSVDLVDYFRGRLTLRKLLVLVTTLRPGARIYEDWSQAEHLAADQVDLLNLIVWQNYYIAGSLVGKKLKKPPKPIRRPADRSKPIKFAKTDDLKAFLSARR